MSKIENEEFGYMPVFTEITVKGGLFLYDAGNETYYVPLETLCKCVPSVEELFRKHGIVPVIESACGMSLSGNSACIYENIYSPWFIYPTIGRNPYDVIEDLRNAYNAYNGIK